MPLAPQVVSAFDDVSPRMGSVLFGEYTNDTAPVLRVALGDQAAAGATLTVTSDRGLATSPLVLTAEQVAQGFVDVPMAGLPEGFSLLTANLRRTDGSMFASTAGFALGIATAIPAPPVITGAEDNVGSDVGPLASGAHTDDSTPTFRIFEEGLPPAPEGPPGHPPFGGPPLLGGRIQLYEGGQLLTEANLSVGGVVVLTPDVLAPGEHLLTAVAIDRAGNASAASAPFRIHVDAASRPSNAATNGDDVLQASAAAPLVEGGPGDDTIMGGAFAGTLRGGPGDDSIVGGTGFNAINGNQGADTVVGQSTVGDWLRGGQGDDLIDARGSGVLNIANGNQGDDTILGGAGGSILRGGQGNDVLAGGAGDDWISGDMGQNTLTGGGGADTFLATPGRHTDRVLDFDVGAGDRVLILRGQIHNTSQIGGDTVVRVGQGEVVLVGVPFASLGTGWVVEI